MTGEGKEFIDTSVPRGTLVDAMRSACEGDLEDPGTVKTLQKLGFVLLRYSGFTMKEACGTMSVSLQTGYNWQNSWNESGMESLHPRYAGGRPSKLDDGDRLVLNAYVLAEHPSTRDVSGFISDRFGIEYSEKQVHTIMKSMGFVHISEKKLDPSVRGNRSGGGKALMRWMPPSGRYGHSNN